MHERTQRAIARLMFVFCRAVPTLITLLCVLVTVTPWYHHRSLLAIEQGLSDETGMIVEIDDFERAAPSTLQLHGVRVIEPETGREVARVRQVHWVAGGEEVAVLLQQPELQSRELAGAWRLLHDRFLCRPQRTRLPVQVAANDLTIHSNSGAQTFRDARAWIAPRDQEVEASIQCTPADSRSESPVTITVRRDRSGDTPLTHWFLDTGGTPLPCSALAEYFPQLESLGSDATFMGTMRWQLQDKNRWWIDLGGSQFEQVSLDRLFERQSHRLSGMASIRLERCRIDPAKPRSDIAGSIRAADGQIGQSLLYSVNQHLGFEVRIPQDLIETRRDVPFDLMAIAFQVNNTQLQLDGICRTEVNYHDFPPGVVLSLDFRPLVRSSDQTLDSLSVIRAIAPSHSVVVPLSRQTTALMNIFIPPSRPLPSDERFPPRIQSAEHWSGGPIINQPR